MSVGLTVAALLFTTIDALSFLSCAVLMMRFICMYTQEGARRNRPLFVRILGWAGYEALAVLLPNLFLDDVLTISALLCYYLLLGWFVYHKSQVGILYQVFYILVMYASQVIAIMCAYTVYLKFSTGEIVYSYLIAMFKSVFGFSILWVFFQILKKKYAKDQKNLKIGRMVLIPFLSTVLMLMYIVAQGASLEEGEFGYLWMLVFCIIILVINGLCLHFWYSLSVTQELKNRLELTRRQNQLTYQYYGEMEENYNKSRKIIHDIRNHMQMLKQSCKMKEAEEYFADVHEMLDALGLKFYCENRMLNIVLNDKCRYLPKEEFHCNLAGAELDFLADIDVTAIFANLLDNALEAREKEEEFKLKIHGEQIQDFTVIEVSNTFHGVYRKGCSGKAGHEGLGLMNVRQAVEKYHGEMRVAAGKDLFSVTLVFPGR